MPCYDDPRPLVHYQGLFWPHPETVRLDILPTAHRWGITEDEIRWVMEHEPRAALAFNGNDPDPDADEFHQTSATYAMVLEDENYLIEIVLRQDLSEKWKERCRRERRTLPRCIVFHAMRKPRIVQRRRRT